MARFHITVTRPSGYPHSDCFREVAEGLYYALRSLGYPVTFAENHTDSGATSIVLGAHLLTSGQAEALPASTVIYNLEQLGVSVVPDWYMSLAARLQVWDYTPVHIPQWQAVPCRLPPRLMEIGYVRELPRIKPASRLDIDVLFYGSPTTRRLQVLGALKAEGLHVHTAYGVYGGERDALIARSKVVLNLHAADTETFEIVRVSYLLANAKAVVAEQSIDFGPLTDAVAVCTHANAVSVCQRLLADGAERRTLEQRGFRLFSARPQTGLLAPAVGPLGP